MIIIADSGSTKTDWVLCNSNGIVARANTQGFNPTIQGSEEIFAHLAKELPGEFAAAAAKEIFFYGAGCAYDTANVRMKEALRGIFATQNIHVPWRREWLPTPVLFPGEFHGKRSLAGYSLLGCRVRHD